MMMADVSRPMKAEEACAGAAVVYHCVNAPYSDWPARFPPLTASILEGVSRAGARLVFADNLYMYGLVSGAMTEALPYHAQGRKGITRARMAEDVMEAHASGSVPVTIGRASDFFGPGVTRSVLGEQVFGNAVGGRPARVLGRLDVLHSHAFVEDFAWGLVTLGEKDQALGEAWHVPTAEPTTAREFLDTLFSVLGTRVGVRTAGPGRVAVLGVFSPLLREMKEMDVPVPGTVRGRPRQVRARLREPCDSPAGSHRANGGVVQAEGPVSDDRTAESPGQRVLSMWRRLTPFPAGRWLFSRLLGRMVPYTDTIRARVLELEPGGLHSRAPRSTTHPQPPPLSARRGPREPRRDEQRAGDADVPSADRPGHRPGAGGGLRQEGAGASGSALRRQRSPTRLAMSLTWSSPRSPTRQAMSWRASPSTGCSARGDGRIRSDPIHRPRWGARAVDLRGHVSV